jgi:hypothetical protein
MTLIGMAILNNFAVEARLSLPYLLGAFITELTAILCFLIFICPLNGGAGEGHW